MEDIFNIGEETPQTENDGPERQPCPDCGKEVTWTKAGKPRQHKCEPKVQQSEPETANAEENFHSSEPASLVERCLAKYIETRDEIDEIKAKHKEELAELNAVQEKRATFLKNEMNKMGVTQIKVKGIGQSYFEDKSSAKVEDRTAFFNWVFADPERRSRFFENRVAKSEVKELVEGGETLPPGIGWTVFKDVKIRRA